MRWHEMMRRVMSFCLAALMLVSSVPVDVFVHRASAAETGGICEHHPQHDASCGYAAGVTGQACNHGHDSDCGYVEEIPGIACDHTHDTAVCGFVAEIPPVDCDHQHSADFCGAPDVSYPNCGHTCGDGFCNAAEGVACDHVCGTEVCGQSVTTWPQCVHNCADGTCAYSAGAAGSPCGHSCTDGSCSFREGVSGVECSHKHDEACGYVEEVKGSDCSYQCKPCADYNALVKAFEELLEKDDLEGTTQEDRDALMEELEKVFAAYDDLWDQYEDMGPKFNENYGELVLAAQDLNDAIINYEETVVDDASVYKHVAYVPNTNDNMTITVADENGNRITGAAITVTRSNNTYEVQEQTNGQYQFTRDQTGWFSNYSITVEKTGYLTKTVSVYASSTSTTITLEDGLVPFRVYYKADGKYPEREYQGAASATLFGPSGDDSPLVTIEVDLLKLEAEFSDTYIYSYKSDSSWYYIPKGSLATTTHDTNVIAFWNAVWACTTPESKAAFRATGFSESDFYGYVLKKQSASDSGNHLDGILTKEPPMYVVELYHNGHYFGGSVTGSDAARQSLTSIQDAAERQLGGYDIQWTADGYTGIYFIGIEARSVALTQSNKLSAVSVEGSEFPYEKKSDLYYLAQFDLDDQSADGYHTVTYTDGVDTAVIFPDQGYAAQEGEPVPAFKGVPTREGHEFKGWHLEKKENQEGQEDHEDKLYSAEEIATMTVNTDMVFHAHWELIPTTFAANVYVHLDGIYNSETKEVTGGSPVTISTVLGTDTQLYLKEQNGTDYIELGKVSTGHYSATVGNGNYHIYYANAKTNNEKKALDDQILTINGADRSRYVFFNSVAYNLNGGSAAADFPIQYYMVGSAAAVVDQKPTREGYVFNGWQEDTKIYQPGASLTAAIGEPHVLVAQWVDAMDVYVNITIHHNVDQTSNTADTRHDIDFTLDCRTSASDEYEETYRKSLTYRDNQEFSDETFALDFPEHDGHKDTRYSSKVPVITGVPSTYQYTLTTSKTNYHLESVTTSMEANGKMVVDAVLRFAPSNQNLEYEVVLDEAAMKLPPELKPTAVNVKVTRWYDAPYNQTEGEDWFPIAQHQSTYTRVVLDKNGEGSGQNSVWVLADDTTPYCYRIEVVSFEYQGSVIPAVNQSGDHVNYDSWNGRFSAAVETNEECKKPDGETTLSGAYFKNGSQVGTVRAVVSIPVRTVTFDPNDGELNGSQEKTVLNNQLVVPVLEDYVPTREGAYTFGGWYLADDQGQMTENTVTSGSALNGDITLIAKWKEPLKITVNVDAAASYKQTINDETTTQTLHEADRVNTLPVSIQKKLPNGYMETLWTANVTMAYNEDKKITFGSHTFEGIPDDGSEYAVLMHYPNFTATYQNEPESLIPQSGYAGYSATDRDAEFGTDGPTEAVVNGWLSFNPVIFPLQYQVDASAIGEGFRPESVDLLITYDDKQHSTTDPSQWPVISQMILQEEEYPDRVSVGSDGKGSGSYDVWVTSPDGVNPYEYGLCKKAINGTVIAQYADAYTVSYQAPARYTAPDQSRMLIAKLTPKSYPITYELNAGSDSVTGMTSAVKNHTWSRETPITAVPVRSGYTFLGWYTKDDAGNYSAQPVTEIPAEHADATTLHAKWLQVQDSVDLIVTINHTNDGGFVNNYDKELSVQLLHAEKKDASLMVPVAGMTQSYHGDEWHTQEDNVREEIFAVNDVFHNLSSEYKYDLSVVLDSYYVTERKVTPQVQDNGSTKYVVEITLQYLPDRLNFTYSAEMAPGTDPSLWPSSVNVRVTCWYAKTEGQTADWNPITQHSTISRTIPIGANGSGSDSYNVWQWFNKDNEIPYYYRIEVLSLNMPDGSTISNRTVSKAHEEYALGDYTVAIETSGCRTPNDSALPGAYGSGVIESGVVSHYTQVGSVKAVISVDRWNDPEDKEVGGDETPDHQQALIRFESEDTAKGTVSGRTSQIFTLTKTDGAYTDSVQPEAVQTNSVNDAYEFTHWTLNGEKVENPFALQTVQGGEIRTYVAHWKWKDNLSYTVNYWLRDVGSDYVLDSNRTITVPDMEFGHKVDSSIYYKNGITGYVFERVNVEELVIGSDVTENVINVYFARDNWDEVGSDGTADYKQALVHFESADESMGTVSGKTSQVFTLENNNGAYTGTVLPEAVAADPIEGYRFDHWAPPSGPSMNTLEAPFTEGNELTVEGGHEYVYTAHWTIRNDCTYTVKYLDKETNTSVAEDKVVQNKTYGTDVTENARTVDGYNLDGAASQTLTIGTGENIIIFYYNIREDLSLTVYHYDIDKRTQLIPPTQSTGLTFGIQPKIADLVEPIEGFEHVSSSPESITIGTGKNVLELFYKRQNYAYKVFYHYEGSSDLDHCVEGTAPFGSTVEYEDINNNSAFTLDYVTGSPLTISDEKDLNVIHVYYSLDGYGGGSGNLVTPDGIPDKYQTYVAFSVENGTWVTGGTEKSVIYKVYTLYSKSTENGQWYPKTEGVKLGDEFLDNQGNRSLPTGQPDEGYTDFTPNDGVSGTWDPAITPETPVTQNDAHYVLSYVPESYTITAIVVNGTGEVVNNTGEIIGDKFQNATYDLTTTYSDSEKTTFKFTKDADYALDTVTVDGEPENLSSGGTIALDHTSSHTIRVVYAKDELGEGGKPDDTPDKYQSVVTYRVVNGQWKIGNEQYSSADIVKAFNYYDRTTGGWTPKDPEMKPQQLGTIPTGKADEGYDDNNFEWLPKSPVNDYAPAPGETKTYILDYDPKQYIITVIVDNGTGKVGNNVVTNQSFNIEHDAGNSTTITFTGNAGHMLEHVVVDGNPGNLDEDGKITIHHKSSHTIHVTYTMDTWNDDEDSTTKGDGTPDKYQAKVEYHVLNGFWELGETDHSNPIVQVYTLMEKDSTGKWNTIEPAVTLDNIPVGLPKEGYSGGSWSPLVPTTDIVVPAQGATYTLTHNINKYAIRAEVINGTAYEGNTPFTEKKDISHHATDKTVLSFAPTQNDGNHYVLYKVTVDGADVILDDGAKNNYTHTFYHDGNHDIRVVYELDNHGTENPNEGDGVPDIFQKKITYRVHNGTFGAAEDQIQRIETYVTLQENGKPSASGSAELIPPANMTPAVGYEANGKWDHLHEDEEWDEEHPKKVTGTTPEIYDFRFTDRVMVDVIIRVTGGTSSPVPSVETHEYNAQNYPIVFTPKENYILDKVTVNNVDLNLAENTINGSPAPFVRNDDGTYTYTYQRTADFEIEVVFVKDEWKDGNGEKPDAVTGGDNIADYKQAVVRFQAGENGTVSGDLLNVYTLEKGENGVYSGSVDLTKLQVATKPAQGYRFAEWTPGTNPFVVTSLYGGQELVYTAQFEKDDFDYTVKYYFDGKQNLDLKSDETHEAEYQTEITVTPDVRTGTEGEYLLDTVNPEKLVIDADETKNLIEVFYATDVWKDDPSNPTNSKDSDQEGDNKPDYQQAMIKYVAGDHGRISGAAVQVFTLHQTSGLYTGVVNPEDVTPVPAVGYKFSKWTYPDGTDVPTDRVSEIFAPHNVNGGDEIVYTALFEKDTFGYSVEYYFDGVKNPTLKDTVSGTALYGTDVEPEIANKISHYILETKIPENGKIHISENSANNVLKLYYVTDNWKDDTNNPQNDAETGGDGTPDKYQVLVKFVSSDETKGTVTGSGTLRVYTFAATDSVVTVEPSYHDVNTQPNEGYAFDYWTRDDQNLIPVIPTQPVVNVTPGSTIVFKAQFAEDTNKDKTPDKYQATVTYVVENGSWSDGETKDISTLFNLYAWNAEKMAWEAQECVLGATIPTGMKPNAAYEEPGYWGDKDNAEDDPTAETKVTDNATYKFTYGDPKTFSITITVENGTSTPAQTSLTVNYGDDPEIKFAPNSGFAFDFVKVDGNLTNFNVENGYKFTDVVTSHTIHVKYAEDSWSHSEDSTKPDSPTGGDGTPDYRQALVKFQTGDNGTLEGTAVSATDRTALYVVNLPESNNEYKGTFQTNANAVKPKPGDGYAFDCWEMNVNGTAASGNHNPYEPAGIAVEGGKTYELTACFAPDRIGGDNNGENIPDGFPDYKQAIVRFVAREHGTISGTSFFELKLTENAEGDYIGTFNTTEQAVKAVADTGYKLKNWTLIKKEGAATTSSLSNPYSAEGLSVIGNGEYVFAASFEVDNKTVKYPDAENNGDDAEKTVQSSKYIKVDPNGGIWLGSKDVRLVQITDNYTIADPLRKDYLFLGWKCREAQDTDDGLNGEDVVYVFTAQWETDTVGAWDENGGETGDGIPDRYQKKVTFRIVNGYWADNVMRIVFANRGNDKDIVYYLTLLNTEGQMSETGTAVLKDLIPTGMRAKRGYYNGRWDITPPDTVSGTDSVVYTYRFVVKPSYIPNTGDTSNIHIWVILMSVTGALLVVVVIINRKNKNR